MSIPFQTLFSLKKMWVAISWLSFVVSNCEFVTFPMVSWVRCGTWLYRFLIFAPSLTSLSRNISVTENSCWQYMNMSTFNDVEYLNGSYFDIKQWFYLDILTPHMLVIPNPKMVYIFPISCILVLIFPIFFLSLYMIFSPKCAGKGRLPKS